MAIQDKAMLVHLNISTWTARKFDPKVTQEIEDSYSAVNSGRYNKILIASEYLANIQKLVSAARKYHYDNTLAWNDNGGRLLPAEMYFGYIAKMEEFKNSLSSEVRSFIRMYPDYKEEARRRLNGMFSEDDYPSIDELQGKYNFNTDFTPIPDAQDFRVQLNEHEVESIRQSLISQVDKSTKTAMTDLWNRLYAVVEHMIERLSDADNKFKNSLVGNIRELCEILPKLNITEDKYLEQAVAEVKSKLAGYEPDNLRNDKNLRSQAVSDAKDILSKMKHYAPAA
jgi:hypothetical protein